MKPDESTDGTPDEVDGIPGEGAAPTEEVDGSSGEAAESDPGRLPLFLERT